MLYELGGISQGVKGFGWWTNVKRSSIDLVSTRGAFLKPRVQSGAFQEESLKIIEVGVGGRVEVDESQAISGAVDT